MSFEFSLSLILVRKTFELSFVILLIFLSIEKFENELKVSLNLFLLKIILVDDFFSSEKGKIDFFLILGDFFLFEKDIS